MANFLLCLAKAFNLVLFRTQWKKCTFSGDGEFIVAGSHRQHALYIWDKATGSLVKMLTGQKGETLLDIVWHPVRPIILSISTGVVNVWSQAHVELWSAYAPNFKEMDENEEYEEKEDEFDIEDEDALKREGDSREDEEVAIDVVAVPPIPAFCSSDEDDEEPLDWLPIAPEIEDPEEPGWGQLEPSLNELPVDSGDRKRPANDENVDPALLPPAKQPRTIEIDLPSRHDDSSEPKEGKSKANKENSKPTKKGKPTSKSSQKSQPASQKGEKEARPETPIPEEGEPPAIKSEESHEPDSNFVLEAPGDKTDCDKAEETAIEEVAVDSGRDGVAVDCEADSSKIEEEPSKTEN